MPPTDEGHDFCVTNLGGVVNACCGHGVEEGYIQFDNGVIVRGMFTIENINDIKEGQLMEVETEI